MASTTKVAVPSARKLEISLVFAPIPSSPSRSICSQQGRRILLTISKSSSSHPTIAPNLASHDCCCPPVRGASTYLSFEALAFFPNSFTETN